MQFLILMMLLVGAKGQRCNNTQEHNSVNLKDATGIEIFGMDLFSRLAQSTPGNVVLGPYSLWRALATVLPGATGLTEQELSNVLGFAPDEIGFAKKLDAYYRKKADGKRGRVLFQSFNKAYFDHSLKAKKCVVETNSRLEEVDFSNSELMAQMVNGNVSKVTKGKITELVQPEDLKGALFMILNANYFKGNWLHQFNPDLTSEKDFFGSGNQVVGRGPMMTLAGKSLVFHPSSTLQSNVVFLPYESGSGRQAKKAQFEMALVQPFANATDPADLSHVLTTLREQPDVVDRARNAAQERPMKLFMPKFTAESTFNHELKKSLREMGLDTLFRPDMAKLDKFTDTPLFVEKMIHKAVVTIDETGSEAAAATGILATKGPLFTDFISLDRPFVFLIRGGNSVSLFAGAVRNPFPSQGPPSAV